MSFSTTWRKTRTPFSLPRTPHAQAHVKIYWQPQHIEAYVKIHKPLPNPWIGPRVRPNQRHELEAGRQALIGDNGKYTYQIDMLRFRIKSGSNRHLGHVVKRPKPTMRVTWARDFTTTLRVNLAPYWDGTIGGKPWQLRQRQRYNNE